MAVRSFSEIRRTVTKETIRTWIYESLEGVTGFPVTSWQSGAVPRMIVNGVAVVAADLYNFGCEIAEGAYGGTARGPWATLWSKDRFDLEPNPEATAVGWMLAADHGGGAHNPGVGAFVVGADPDDGRTWVSTAAVTIPLNGSVLVPMRGSKSGSAYNLPNNAPLRVLSGHATVTVTNPPVAGSETWLTTPGADEEEPEALARRAPLRWAEVSLAAPPANFYKSLILRNIPTITKVRILDDNPLGPWSVVAVCGSGAGPATAGDITLANAVLRANRAVGSGTLLARASTSETITVGGVAYVAAAHRATARAAVIQELAALQASLDIGGTVYAAEIIRIVKAQAGVRNYVPSTGLVDLTASEDAQVAILHAIDWRAE